VIFTTIHKFIGSPFPEYDFIDGFARHMRDALPKASFIGFTGTPIESGDKNTQAVFGDLGGVPNTCEFDSL